MDIVDKLKATLHYMDTHPDFNESVAVMHVVEAIQTIESLRNQLSTNNQEKVLLIKTLKEARRGLEGKYPWIVYSKYTQKEAREQSIVSIDDCLMELSAPTHKER